MFSELKHRATSQFVRCGGINSSGSPLAQMPLKIVQMEKMMFCVINGIRVKYKNVFMFQKKKDLPSIKRFGVK